MSYSAILNIFSVDEKGFHFDLLMINGAHSGHIRGFGLFQSKDEAIFNKKGFNDETCTLRFFKSNDIIQVSADEGCRRYGGARAFFQGDYRLKKEIFYHYDFMSDIVLSRIFACLQEDLWEEFLKCFGDVHVNEFPDTEGLYQFNAGVPGLYNILEAVLVVDAVGHVFGAFLDVDKVYRFSSIAPVLHKGTNIVDEFCNRFTEAESIILTETKRKGITD